MYNSVPNYYLNNGTYCQPANFARWLNVDFNVGNVSKVCLLRVWLKILNLTLLQLGVTGDTSEASCIATCTTYNPVNGPWGSAVYRTNSCSCKGAASVSAASATAPSIFTGFLVGTCSMYTTIFTSLTCQTVTFISGTCMGLDGTGCLSSTCKDPYATVCDSTGAISKTW